MTTGRTLTGVFGILLSACLLLACGGSVDLYSGLSEHDANEIISALQERGISGSKQFSKQGAVVKVAEADFPSALSALRARGLPRNTFARMGEVFKKDGMISTPTEERGRYLFAISQELENTLSQIDGIILARVHPVLPERMAPGEPVLPSSCSVLIKYRPGWEPDLYEGRIRRLVLAGIPGLAAANKFAVSVVFVPASDVAQEELPTDKVLGRAQQGRDHQMPWWLPLSVFSFMASLCMVLGAYFYQDKLKIWVKKFTFKMTK
jgi:type III secretion protein J